MNYILGGVILLIAVALIYYLANPENHNSWNGGKAPAFNPKSKEGKIIHNTLQTIGLIAVWIIILAIVLTAIFS